MRNAIRGGLSVVFSQGPMRLSPLLGITIARHKDSDVLIGLPRKQFNDLAKEYQNSFLSFHSGIGRFFYQDMLWCTAEITTTGSTLEIKEVATKPKWGKSAYKNKCDEILRQQLVDGTCYNWPRILCIPIDTVLPENILGNTRFTYGKKTYNLAPFTPSFVILESVNERIYSIDPVIAMIESLRERSIDGVIHFSWPYFPGVEKLQSQIAELNKQGQNPITVLHLGKRYCLEMKDRFNDYVLNIHNRPYHSMERFLRDHSGFRNFSVEGRYWNDCYPLGQHATLGEGVTVAVVDYDGTTGGKPLLNLAQTEGPFDGLMQETISSVVDSEKEGFTLPWKPFIIVPPFFDSFVLPMDTKVFCQNDNGEYRALQLVDALRVKVKSHNPAIGSFANLCSQMDTVSDFAHMIQGISTFRGVGKSTALMCYLYNEIRNPEKSEARIILSNYSSNPGFVKGTVRNIEGLLNVLKLNPELTQKDLPHTKCYCVFHPNGQSQTLNGEVSLVKTIDYTIHSSGRRMEVTVTFATPNSSDKSGIKKKITILLIDFEQISTVLPSTVIEGSVLILPGPLPIFTFKEDTPVATKGFDSLFRPFAQIIIFTYAGDNLARCLDQISVMDELTGSDSSNPLVRKDLGMSLMNAPKNLVEGIENPISDISQDQGDNGMGEDPLDSTIRAHLISQVRSSSHIEAKSLEEIWDSISKQTTPEDIQRIPYSSYANDIEFDVQFIKDSRRENIRLNPSSYVRVIEPDGTSLCLAENLSVGQEIAYLMSETKESLDNYFIRNFSESRGWTLEDVFEPFTCLSHFAETLMDADYGCDYIESQFSKLYWLSPSQRENLFMMIR
ncbi:MAG: hypothetical protein E4H14_11570, partial [Candidatus Thorarchaeota archaeon]